MSNESIGVLQNKTATAKFENASGGVVPAGGPIAWSVVPANAVSFSAQNDAAQTVVVTGETAGAGAVLSAKEPVSGFTATLTFDVLAVQLTITQGTITLA